MPKKKIATPEKKELENAAAFRTAVNRCAELEAQIAVLEARKKERTVKLGKAFDARKQPLAQEMNELLDLCHDYAEAHPDVLKPGTRSGETEAAEYGFHLGNPSVNLLKKNNGGWEAVVKRIAEHGDTWKDALYLHRPDEVSKEAVLAAHRAFSSQKDGEESTAFTLNEEQLAALGLKIVQDDSFYIHAKPKN